VENITIPGCLRAVFARSIMSHAEVREIRGVDEARSMPGVVAVFTAADLNIPPQPPSGNVESSAAGELSEPFFREVLARDRVRYAGEAIAVVVAESLAQAEDAAELVWFDGDAIDPVLDPKRASEADAPLLWPEMGTNVAHTFEQAWDTETLAGADVVARGRFENQRVAPVPLEPNAVAVIPEGDERYTVYVSTQVPFDVRDDVAELLGVDRLAVRTIAPDVGGGFGAKLQVYPEYLVIARASQRLGRPVRWVESRSESMLNLTHGRAQIHLVEIGARRDGEIIGLRAEIVADMGAYPIGAFLPMNTAKMLAGVYRIPQVSYRGRCVVTNATPVAPYRGAGRPEATALVERAVDLVANELGMDPVEVRRRNLIPSSDFPYTTAVGTTYDTGDYARALDEALRIAGYAELRAEQAARRSVGDHLALGIGVSTYVEITSFSSKEFGAVQVDPSGRVIVFTGSSPQGQGHETAFAQIASGVMGVPFDAVRVVHSDSALVERGGGTWGSRSLQAGGSAVLERSFEVVGRARTIAAHLLEVDPADLEGPAEGIFRVRGVPDQAVSWAELASASVDPSRVPEVLVPGPLRAEGVYREPGSTFPFGAHISVVEVDIQTGDARAMRHVAVDDCGRILNPVLVRGQQHGGLAQGIAQALFERMDYDEVGNPSTSTLAEYRAPSATELPPFEVANTETPTPVNPLGVKGIGESATIGSTPAVQNAVVDALAHLGVQHVDLPCSPERVLGAIRSAAGP
jgi:aerobic carbon-monoxide dehydrogenase large subunit